MSSFAQASFEGLNNTFPKTYEIQTSRLLTQCRQFKPDWLIRILPQKEARCDGLMPVLPAFALQDHAFFISPSRANAWTWLRLFLRRDFWRLSSNFASFRKRTVSRHVLFTPSVNHTCEILLSVSYFSFILWFAECYSKETHRSERR